MPPAANSRRQRVRESWRRIALWLTSLDLARARFLHDKPSIAEDLAEIARRRLQLHELDRAHDAYVDARTLAVKIGYDTGIARADAGLAEIAYWRGEPESVVELVEGALPRMRSLGADVPLSFVLWLFGEALIRQERPTAALEAFREAERIAVRRGDWKQEARAIYGIGMAAYQEGRLPEAIDDWTAAMQIFQRHRDIGGVAWMQHWLSVGAGAEGRLEDARRFAIESIHNYDRAGRPDIAEGARGHLADVDEFIAGRAAEPLDDQP